jgi:cell wall-associated NlpC family hydrolase
LNFTRPFLRFTLIAASLLGLSQPGVALAAHHHVKKNRIAHVTHLNHKINTSHLATKQNTSGLDFIINPDNSIVKGGVLIPAVYSAITPEPRPTTITTMTAVKKMLPLPPQPHSVTRTLTQVTTHSAGAIEHMFTAAIKQPAPVVATQGGVLEHILTLPIQQHPAPLVERIVTPVTAPVTVSQETGTPSRVLGSLAFMHKHIIDFVMKTVSTLRYSDYKLGGSKFDTSRGIYIVDCSSFVDHILQKVSPQAYTSLVNATGAPTPATQHYYEFFNELSSKSDDNWNKVNNVEQLRAGDILVFRNKHNRRAQVGGHVMVVMEKPVNNMGVYFVRVADSAPSRHSEDTRQLHEGGIGIGTLLLKAAKGGRPLAYAWAVGGLWNKNVNFAMARPAEWD